MLTGQAHLEMISTEGRLVREQWESEPDHGTFDREGL